MSRTISIDKYGRAGLGKEFANKTYLVEEQEDGSLLLVPGQFVSAAEAKILEKPEIRASLENALAQASAGNLMPSSNYEKAEFLFSEDATLEDIENEVSDSGDSGIPKHVPTAHARSIANKEKSIKKREAKKLKSRGSL